MCASYESIYAITTTTKTASKQRADNLNIVARFFSAPARTRKPTRENVVINIDYYEHDGHFPIVYVRNLNFIIKTYGALSVGKMKQQYYATTSYKFIQTHALRNNMRVDRSLDEYLRNEFRPRLRHHDEHAASADKLPLCLIRQPGEKQPEQDDIVLNTMMRERNRQRAAIYCIHNVDTASIVSQSHGIWFILQYSVCRIPMTFDTPKHARALVCALLQGSV